jgi:N4-gp56 family major capsid protein
MYNAPPDTPSSVGNQIYTEYYYKKALVTAAKEQFFGQLADTTAMPKHFGKTIKLFHYLPILDDRNVNDQGIDAQGVTLAADFAANTTYAKVVYMAQAPDSLGGMKYYFEGVAQHGTNSAGAITAATNIAKGKLLAFMNNTMKFESTDYADWVTDSSAVTAPTTRNPAVWYVVVTTSGDEYNYGNLYGSSKDVGTIQGKIPALGEGGGRVNRVGMTRLTIEGSIEKFGFFEESTQDSLDFDNDSELEMHITTEAVKAANEITEDQLQIDLLNGAGVIRYTGLATSVATLTGGTIGNGARDKVIYDDLVKLGIELDQNRTPKNTRLITGSRMIDTRVVNAARYMYVGSELLPTLMKMEDYHGERAWIPVAQYGAATQIARGEHGSIADFRIIVVPEMMHWEAAGATVGDPTDEVCYWSTDGAGTNKYNVYPMLVVGDGSFTTIGFQTDGKQVKFKITHKKPGAEVADRFNPYGTTGFYSIHWWYGTLILRPERLALIKTVAEM